MTEEFNVLRHALLAILAASGLYAGVSEAKHPVTLGDLDGVALNQTVIATTLDASFDGRRVAIEHGHQLWVVDVKTHRITRDLGDGIAPTWSPDGAQLGFYSNRSGALQIWTWTLRTGQLQQLTNMAGGIDVDPSTRVAGTATDALRFSWSPDGGQIVFASRVNRPFSQSRPTGAPLILTNATRPQLTLSGVFAQPSSEDGIVEIKDGRTWGYRARKADEILFSQLFVVNARTLGLRQITDDARAYFHPDWSPDGHSIVFAAAGAEDAGQHGAVSRGWDSLDEGSSGDIIAIDISSGKQRTLATGAGVKHRPRWSPDGGRIAYLVNPTTFEDPRIRVVSLADGKEQTGLTLDRKLMYFDWAARNEFLVSYFDSGSKLGRFRPGWYRVGTMKPRVLWSADVWSYARSGLTAWVEGFSGSKLWVLPPGTRKPVGVIELDRRVEELDLGRVETVTWRTQQGDTMEGQLLYPPDYQTDKKYPAIVDVYPLGGGSHWMHPMQGNQTWAAAGYVVFKPNPRAPHAWLGCSKSADFCSASKGPAAWDVMVDDVMSGVAALVQRGIVDPDRMCLYGHSNGATTVAYLVTQTNRFKCAIAVASALSDWVSLSFLNTDDSVTDLVGEPPWQDPGAYIRLSPVFHVNQIQTPMLLVVGDNDGVFLLGTIEMYNALRHAGKEVTLLRYPGQGHLFVGPAIRDLWDREMAFFAKYLNPPASDVTH